MFENRFYLGELHHKREGVGTNLRAHDPLVTPDLFHRVQQRKGKLRGRYAKSDYLLARQRVLRCASCGGRMSASSRGNQRPGGFYRCGAEDCDQKAAIDTGRMDAFVTETVRGWLSGAKGHADLGAAHAGAVAGLEAAETAPRPLSRPS